MKYKNPIIRGFYPDPSVCKANGKYYLVSSTFHYFPGVPLFESEDLINWKQIGHCLTRESQLPLKNAHSSGGIFAPTIRYNNGRFYMTTTNVTQGGNFYVYTDDIYGEWSEPIFVEQEGIDPSLYFEDNKAYFMSNGHDPENKDVPAIIQSEIDIKTGKRLSETKALWSGTGGRYLESPHLYKIGDYYYLTAAEGGTEYGHMVTYARSENLWGKYESFSKNPVLTNRNLGGYTIQGVGHADLIEDYNGNWWLFHLGFRQIDKWLPFHHLGREVFLMPADFNKDKWFTVVGGITSEIVETVRIPSDVKQECSDEITENDWCFLREYKKENYVFDKNTIKIKSSKQTIDSIAAPAFAGIRQKEFDTDFSVTVKAVDGEAGITVFMDEEHHYDLSIINAFDGYHLNLMLNIGGIKHCASTVVLPAITQVKLRIVADSLNYRFFYSIFDDEIEVGKMKTRYLSSEVACGFTGVVLALYSQNGKGEKFNEFKDLKIKTGV